MPKWTEYTTKDTLGDNDEVMLYDATGKANKRGLMSKFWDYVVDKMSTAVISKLETENKTVIGALNYLNGKTLKSVTMSIAGVKINRLDEGYGYYSDTLKADIPEGTKIISITPCNAFSAGIIISSINNNEFTLSCSNPVALPNNRDVKIWYI